MTAIHRQNHAISHHFNAMKIQPFSDHIVVKPVPATEQTASGLFLPTANKEKPEQGKVLAVGPGKVENGVRVAIDLKEGDTVLFKKYAPDEFTVNGEKVLVIEASDVIAILS